MPARGEGSTSHRRGMRGGARARRPTTAPRVRSAHGGRFVRRRLRTGRQPRQNRKDPPMHQLLRTRRARLTAAAISLTVAASGVVAVSTGAAAATTVRTTNPSKAAAGWLARQLGGPNHDHYSVSFNGQSFPDAGETIDALLAMDAA